MFNIRVYAQCMYENLLVSPEYPWCASWIVLFALRLCNVK